MSLRASETCLVQVIMKHLKSKVIGVGGGGSNVVNCMIERAMKGVEFWIVNTDVQAMKLSPVFLGHRLQIGQELNSKSEAMNSYMTECKVYKAQQRLSLPPFRYQ